ncbi:MAG: dihydrolipoyl dehydrogenase [Candidatus Omnitrophota bacterium]|jgi:dihydrolipoamide dehydrogenase
MDKFYDIAIIGAGSGGYAACIRASDLGLKCCVIERGLIGGTCLNCGCIPTKVFVRSADLLRQIRQADKFALNAKLYGFDYNAVSARKESIVQKLRAGAEFLIKSKGVDIIKGEALFVAPGRLRCGDEIISSKHIVIASGSIPAELPNLKFDHQFILSSSDMLAQTSLPRSMVIVGGGFIGCEFASIYNQFGVDVSVVELADQLMPGADKEIARRLELYFQKQGIKVFKNDLVISAHAGPDASVKLAGGNELACDKVLLCVGRKADIAGLDLAAAGIRTSNGFIQVDKTLKTNILNTYAIGDVIEGYQLAHVASYEGVLTVENIASGIACQADYSAVPSAVFTYPEIAFVGIGVDKAKEQGLDFQEVKLPLSAVSRAHIQGETDGFVRLLFNARSGKILGAAIFGYLASEMISGFTIAIKNGLTVDSLSKTIFAHPTFSESVFEASGRARA